MSNTFQQVALPTLIRKRRGNKFFTDNSGILGDESSSESSVEPWTAKRPRISLSVDSMDVDDHEAYTPPLITVSPAQGGEPVPHSRCPSTRSHHSLAADGNGDANIHLWSPRSPVTVSSNTSSAGSPCAFNEWDTTMDIDNGNSFDGMTSLSRKVVLPDAECRAIKSIQITGECSMRFASAWFVKPSPTLYLRPLTKAQLRAKILDPQPATMKSKAPAIQIVLSFDKDLVILKTPQNSHMGFMETKIGKELSFLRRHYSVHFDAFILNGSQGQTDIDPRKMIHVVLYGLHENLDDIGGHLSDMRLYLQHPRAYDTSVVYNNPHYFLPPGEKLELPDIISLSLEENEKKSRSRLLNDCLEAFETADIPDAHIFSEIDRIRGLKTPLKAFGSLSVRQFLNVALTHVVSHQKLAVAFMTEKEKGSFEGNSFGSLWEIPHQGHRE
jgi:hypothetical protein